VAEETVVPWMDRHENLFGGKGLYGGPVTEETQRHERERR
jgi:hypothetical protein